MIQIKKRYILIAFLICLSVVVGIILYRQKFNGYSSSYQTSSGVFGDYMGGVLGSFFAFLGFMALLYTVYLQHKDLKATRNEAAENLKIAQENKKFADEQMRVLHIQRFETLFFNMLNQIHFIMESYESGLRGGADNFNKTVEAMVNDLQVCKVPESEYQKFFDSSRRLEDVVNFSNFVIQISNIIELIFIN